MDDQTRMEISLLKSEIENLRSEMATSNPLPIWHNQRVNHFIPEAAAGDDSSFSFKASASGELTATMLSGGITLGPFTRIEWGSITSASLDITVDDATAEWYVWLSVDVRDGAEASEWHEGADMASYWSGLTDEEKKYTTLVPLVYITASDKAVSPDPANWTIDEVKNLQCGDVYIPRL